MRCLSARQAFRQRDRLGRLRAAGPSTRSSRCKAAFRSRRSSATTRPITATRGIRCGPFVNPAFTGPVILGNPNQWFNPAAFLAPPNDSGFYGNLGRDTLIGPGLATWDLSLLKDTRIREKAQPAVSRGVFQRPEPRQFQYAQRGGVHAHRRLADGRRDHQHVHHVAADSIRAEAALVSLSMVVYFASRTTSSVSSMRTDRAPS